MIFHIAVALIGLFGKPSSYDWKVTESLAEDDRLGALFETQALPDGRLKVYARTETLTNRSMLPAHLIALSGGHVHLGTAARAVVASPGLRVLGMQVDCVYRSHEETATCGFSSAFRRTATS